MLATVVGAAQLKGHEYVVEVGAGLGTLTEALARRCYRLHTFELDERLVRYLEGWVLPDARNVVLHDIAFNKYKLEEIISEAQHAGRPLIIVTNLPYQVSAMFLHAVVKYTPPLALTVVMLQREVAQRITATVGQASYSSFSIYVQSLLQTRWICDVPAHAFYPEPKVKSAVVTLAPKPVEEHLVPRDYQLFFTLVERVFKHRRKMIKRALVLAFPALSLEQSVSLLAAANIIPEQRPQQLSPADYLRLAQVLTEQGVSAPDSC